jgi:hypothetical protein
MTAYSELVKKFREKNSKPKTGWKYESWGNPKVERLVAMADNIYPWGSEKNPSWMYVPKDPKGQQDFLEDFDVDKETMHATGGRVGMKPGGLVEPGVTHYATTPSAERMKFLNAATEFVTNGEYTKYNDVPNSERALKIKIGQTATRRQKGVPEGKGAPGVEKTAEHKAKIKETHWSKKKDIKKITHSPKKIAYWESKTKIQKAILEQVENGVLNSKQIAKNLGLSHKEVIDDSEKLFRNIYEQRMKVNKGQKVTSRILPKTREGLKGLLNDLWKVEGFATPEGRNWFKLIRDARESGKITIKQFEQANKNVTNFFKLKNEIQLKYPKLILNLDHPLSYGALESLGVSGEKFLTGIPSTETFNKGIKQRLDIKYASVVSDVRKGVSGAAEKKIAIEKLAKNLNIDIGEISKSGKKIVSLGKKDIVLGKDRIGKSVIQSLKEQNILAKKIKDIDPALTKAADMEGYFKRVNLNKVSKNELKGVAKILSDNGFKCKLQGGLTCNDPRAYMKALEEAKVGAAKGDEVALSKFRKVANGMRKLKGAAALTGWGILGEIGFALPFAAMDYADGQSTARIINNASLGLFGMNEEEETISYLPEGSKGAEQIALEKSYMRHSALTDPDKSFPKGRIGMDPKRFQTAQQDVIKGAHLDLVKKVTPFMQGPRNEYFNEEAFAKAYGEVEAAKAKQAADIAKRKEERTVDTVFDYYDNYLPGIDDDK